MLASKQALHIKLCEVNSAVDGTKTLWAVFDNNTI